MIKKNEIYNEDCLIGMKKIEDKTVDLICTDLPYGQTARNKWDVVIPFNLLWKQYEHIIKDRGAIILFGYGDYGLTSYDSTERYPTSVWTFPKDTQKSALHPTQKPVALIEEIIKTYTDPGALVLDSCAGSCTTAIAAMNTGREYICFEKDRDFFEIGKRRIEERRSKAEH